MDRGLATTGGGGLMTEDWAAYLKQQKPLTQNCQFAPLAVLLRRSFGSGTIAGLLVYSVKILN
jgi:hypothetical protein